MADFKISIIDLQQRYHEEREELLACVERVLESGHFVLTQELTVFEEKVAAYTGAKHCIGLNSGTDALMMGLMTMGVSKGDEVITSPNPRPHPIPIPNPNPNQGAARGAAAAASDAHQGRRGDHLTNLFRCLERLDCPYRRHTGLCRRS